MNIGWLLNFGYFRRWLPKAFRQVSHAAIDRATAEQRGDQPKNNSQGALATHPQSLISFTRSAKPKEASTSDAALRSLPNRSVLANWATRFRNSPNPGSE